MKWQLFWNDKTLATVSIVKIRELERVREERREENIVCVDVKFTATVK
jgi:hypothetical protein